MSVNLWSQTAATNATADSSINWREGQAASTVNNSARAMMAAVAKWRDDQSGNILTGGSSTAYTITSNQGLTPIADGYSIRARMHVTNGASPTLNVDSTGSKAIRVYTSTALPEAAVNDGSVHRFTYDSGNDCWYIGEFFTTTTLPLTGLLINGGTAVTTPAADDEVGIYDLSATANRKITLGNFFKTITALTAETDPATADELALYDASATTADKITLSNLFKVINVFTEDTTPDPEADFVVSYDNSASLPKKIKLKNLSGRVIQRGYAESTSFSTSNNIPNDGTVPQITEGGQVLSQAITPTSATNRIRVMFQGTFEHDTNVANNRVVCALFNGGASALIVSTQHEDDNNKPVSVSFVYEMVAGGTGAITFSVRGSANAGTLSLMDDYGTSIPRAAMIIEEIVP